MDRNKSTAICGGKDNQLTIKTPPIISLVSGKESVNTLVWERMKRLRRAIMPSPPHLAGDGVNDL